MECLSNRFDMAKLIEATIIKGSIKLYPPVISAIRKMAVEHEIIQNTSHTHHSKITDWQLCQTSEVY
jgi:hypothetical protein